MLSRAKGEFAMNGNTARGNAMQSDGNGMFASGCAADTSADCASRDDANRVSRDDANAGSVLQGNAGSGLQEKAGADVNLSLLREWIRESNSIVFFGGAGVSTESGIPDFRSSGGLFSQDFNYPPEEVVSHGFLEQHPCEFFRFLKERMLFPNAKPNAAHRALAKLEGEGKLKAVITQNIDGLHQQAGSKRVFELHGSMLRHYCARCGKRYGIAPLKESADIPRCDCGGIIRPDVVLYGESLDENVLQGSVRAIAQADMLIVGGTSLVVWPAAGLIDFYRGQRLVLINRDETPQDSRCDLVIHDSIGAVLDAAVMD